MKEDITKLLTHAATIEEHVTKGLDRMLEANGVSEKLRSAVAEFIAPAIGLLRDAEKEVIQGRKSALGYPMKEEPGKSPDNDRGR
ncbi:MAG TPA: hypothetical protein VHR66_01825 [Gemmataceae bacterium]|jgi:hypothetical protein|nr:hypothetical protein [Gemmataceae bacterium]